MLARALTVVDHDMTPPDDIALANMEDASKISEPARSI